MNTGTTSLINTRGRVIEVPNFEVELRRSQGWRVVHNPKMEYYANYDLSAGGVTPSENMAENLNEVDVLPGVDV